MLAKIMAGSIFAFAVLSAGSAQARYVKSCTTHWVPDYPVYPYPPVVAYPPVVPGPYVPIGGFYGPPVHHGHAGWGFGFGFGW